MKAWQKILVIVLLLLAAFSYWLLLAGTMTREQAQAFLTNHQAQFDQLATIMGSNPGVCFVDVKKSIAQSCLAGYAEKYQPKDEAAYDAARGIMRQLGIKTAEPHWFDGKMYFVNFPISEGSFIRAPLGVEWRATGGRSPEPPGWRVIRYRYIWWI
jgi:hypothetical protein